MNIRNILGVATLAAMVACSGTNGVPNHTKQTGMAEKQGRPIYELLDKEQPIIKYHTDQGCYWYDTRDPEAAEKFAAWRSEQQEGAPSSEGMIRRLEEMMKTGATVTPLKHIYIHEDAGEPIMMDDRLRIQYNNQQNTLERLNHYAPR